MNPETRKLLKDTRKHLDHTKTLLEEHLQHLLQMPPFEAMHKSPTRSSQDIKKHLELLQKHQRSLISLQNHPEALQEHCLVMQHDANAWLEQARNTRAMFDALLQIAGLSSQPGQLMDWVHWTPLLSEAPEAPPARQKMAVDVKEAAQYASSLYLKLREHPESADWEMVSPALREWVESREGAVLNLHRILKHYPERHHPEPFTPKWWHDIHEFLLNTTVVLHVVLENPQQSRNVSMEA